MDMLYFLEKIKYTVRRSALGHTSLHSYGKLSFTALTCLALLTLWLSQVFITYSSYVTSV